MAESPGIIDLTFSDDDAAVTEPRRISPEEQRRTQARILAQSKAKAQGGEQEEAARRRKRENERAINLALMKSEGIDAAEIFSDEEVRVTLSNNKSRDNLKMKPNTPSHVTSKEVRADRTSAFSHSSARKTESKDPTSTQKPSDMKGLSSIIDGAHSSQPTTSQGAQISRHTATTTIPNGKLQMAGGASLPILDLYQDSDTHGDKEGRDEPEKPDPLPRANRAKDLPSEAQALKPRAHMPESSSAHNDEQGISSRSENTIPLKGSVKLKSPQIEREHTAPQQDPTSQRKVEMKMNAAATSSRQAKSDRHVLPTPAHTPSAAIDYLDDSAKLNDENLIVPLHVDDIERCLRRYQEILHENQEALVKDRFMRAQEQHSSFTGPARKGSRKNPFNNLFSSKSKVATPARNKQESSFVMVSARVPARPGKKPSTTCLHAREFTANAEYVPKVKSIGRLGASHDLLARNIRTLSHMPWFPEDEMDSAEQDRYEELRQKYSDNLQTRSNKRRCRAISDVWAQEVTKLLADFGVEVEDVLYYMLHTDQEEKPTAGTLSPEMEEMWCQRAEDCPTCAKDEDCRSPDWKKVSSLIKRPPTECRLAMAGILCAKFYGLVQINLWHVVSDMRSAILLQQDCLKRLQRKDGLWLSQLDIICYACGQFACITHGAYVEDGDVISNDDSINSGAASQDASDEEMQFPSNNDGRSEAAPQNEVVLDDPELDINSRKYAALPLRQKPAEQHKCGVFCLNAEVSVFEIMGRQCDGSVSGVARMDVLTNELPLFEDPILCDSKTCFWDAEQRDQMRFEEIITSSDENAMFEDKADHTLYQTLLPLSLESKRGPCELALAIPGTTCMDIFYLMLRFLRNPAHSKNTEPDASTIPKETDVDCSNDKILQSRRTFVPCAHAGPCHPSTCGCAEDKVSCELRCGCSSDCARRFKGCNCRDGRRRVCFEDARCECWASNRECNPALCGGCGVQEVLDPVNKYKLDLQLRCKNNRIQLGISKRTVMGVSEVHGWGLYAGEAIAKYDFISEYKGELISILEGNRRGAVYHNLGLEYLFKLGKDQELDGSRVSNKSRFINNSSLTKNINVVAKPTLCNGVSRIMLYALKDIAAGEELFYDYGYHKQVRANFREKPDPVKRTMIPSGTLSTTTSFTASNIATIAAASVYSEPASLLTNDEDDLDETGDPRVLPTSEPDSEFGMPEDGTEESSPESEDNDVLVEAEESDDSSTPLRAVISGPSGLRGSALIDGPSMNPTSLDDLFLSPPRSSNSRTRKRQRITLSQPKLPIEEDSDSDKTPIPRESVSRTHSKDNSSQTRLVSKSKRVPDDQRKRKISANDKRLGGELQRRTAAIRKAKREAERKAAELANGVAPAGQKRKRSEMASSPAQEPSSSQRMMVKLKPLRPTQLAKAPNTPSPKPSSPSRPAPNSDIDSDEESVAMSESSPSVSPDQQLGKDMALQNSSFSSKNMKKAAPSGFGSESTRSIPHGSPHKAQQANGGVFSQQHGGHLSGCGST